MKSDTGSTGRVGAGGGPIKRLFGELSGGEMFTIEGKPSRVYTKLMEQTTPEGSTASWIDGRTKGKFAPVFVHISDDTEVEIFTMWFE